MRRREEAYLLAEQLLDARSGLQGDRAFAVRAGDVDNFEGLLRVVKHRGELPHHVEVERLAIFDWCSVPVDRPTVDLVEAGRVSFFEIGVNAVEAVLFLHPRGAVRVSFSFHLVQMFACM